MDPGRSMPIYPSTVNGIQLGMRNWPSFFVLAYKGYRASKLDSSIVQTAEMAGRLLNRGRMVGQVDSRSAGIRLTDRTSLRRSSYPYWRQNNGESLVALSLNGVSVSWRARTVGQPLLPVRLSDGQVNQSASEFAAITDSTDRRHS